MVGISACQAEDSGIIPSGGVGMSLLLFDTASSSRRLADFTHLPTGHTRNLNQGPADLQSAALTTAIIQAFCSLPLGLPSCLEASFKTGFDATASSNADAALGRGKPRGKL